MTEMPDFIAEVIRQHSHTQAVAKILQDRQEHFITDLSDTDLATLGAFVTMGIQGGPETSAYWRGRIDHELRHRGVCPGCGEDHLAAEMAELSEQEPQIASPHEQPIAIPANDYGTPGRLGAHTQPSLFEVDEQVTGDPIGNILANMDAWNVEYVGASREAEEHLPEKRVRCKGCGWVSQSLEDRMLRPPGVDGCPGCQSKSAHG